MPERGKQPVKSAQLIELFRGVWSDSSYHQKKSTPKIPQAAPAAFVSVLSLSATARALPPRTKRKPRAASNPAQWLPLSKAVPARRFFRGGTRKTPDFPLISTLRRKNFAAARLSS